MRYLPTIKVGPVDNSERSLVLRQQFAIQMFQLLKDDYRLINIDETWIHDAHFVRNKWINPNITNSIQEKKINPRISIIGAIDNEGDVYISLIHANTDSEMFKMFLSKLALCLDRDRPNWRERTILTFDNAQYHISSTVQDFLGRLQIKYMFTGPRCYESSPIESYWSLLKRTDLNPNDLPTGKRTFANIVQIVNERLSEIPRKTVVGLWHHSILALYKYLLFYKL